MRLSRPSPDIIRTGLERRVISPGQVVSVNTPTLQMTPRGFIGATSLKPFDADLLRRAHKVDGYTRRATSKYVSLILKRGWDIEGEEAPVKYLRKRLEMMGEATKQEYAWPLVFEQLVREFVEYANAFMVIGWTPKLPTYGTKPISQKGLMGALFNVTTPQMEPIYNKDVEPVQIGWRQLSKNKMGQINHKDFALDDVIHFWYWREPGQLFGEPDSVAAMQDIHDLRTMEESVLKLVFKHLNPLLHHAVPTVLPNGESLKSDIQAARDAYANLREGVLVTPGGHQLKQIGAESQAIRAEGYLQVFKQRVMAGLGVSAPIMGDSESVTSAGAEALTVQMHTTAIHLQNLLAIFINLMILVPLLKEGGFDPLMYEEDRAYLTFPAMDSTLRIKEEAGAVQLYTNNAISRTELRKKLGLKVEVDDKDMYAHLVQIPQTVAARIGMDPLGMTDDEIMKLTPAGLSKDKTANQDFTSTDGSPGSVSNPQNQNS